MTCCQELHSIWFSTPSILKAKVPILKSVVYGPFATILKHTATCKSHRIAVERPRRPILSRCPERAIVETVVAVVLPAALVGDECVGVHPLSRLPVLGGGRASAPLGRALVVLLQVGGLEGLAQGQLFGVAYA